MSDNGLWIYLGTTMTVSSLVAIFRPEMLVRESRRNWEAPLRELDAGSPETYFEERRELEAYPPRFNPNNQTLRRFGFVGLCLGIASLLAGFF